MPWTRRGLDGRSLSLRWRNSASATPAVERAAPAQVGNRTVDFQGHGRRNQCWYGQFGTLRGGGHPSRRHRCRQNKRRHGGNTARPTGTLYGARLRTTRNCHEYSLVRARTIDHETVRWVPLEASLPVNPYNDKGVLLVPLRYLRALPTVNLQAISGTIVSRPRTNYSARSSETTSQKRVRKSEIARARQTPPRAPKGLPGRRQ